MTRGFLLYCISDLRLKGIYGNVGFSVGFLVKAYDTIYPGMKGMIFPHIYIVPGIMFCPPLAYDDIPGNSCLSAENLDAQPFRFRFSSVL